MKTWNVAVVSLFTVSLLSFVQNYFASFSAPNSHCAFAYPVVLVMFVCCGFGMLFAIFIFSWGHGHLRCWPTFITQFMTYKCVFPTHACIHEETVIIRFGLCKFDPLTFYFFFCLNKPFSCLTAVFCQCAAGHKFPEVCKSRIATSVPPDHTAPSLAAKKKVIMSWSHLGS